MIEQYLVCPKCGRKEKFKDGKKPFEMVSIEVIVRWDSLKIPHLRTHDKKESEEMCMDCAAEAGVRFQESVTETNRPQAQIELPVGEQLVELIESIVQDQIEY